MRVAINGAGIAGATLAWWLRRFGHEVLIVEKAHGFRTGGYLLDLWGIGYDVAEKMGVLPRLQAVLFATRDDYTAALGAEVPQIEMTRGYYADQRRMAFFHIEDPGLADVEDMASSWRHEATHQLFDQRRSGRSQLTRQRGTCLIEAIAMHMESLRVHPGYVTVGGVDARPA